MLSLDLNPVFGLNEVKGKDLNALGKLKLETGLEILILAISATWCNRIAPLENDNPHFSQRHDAVLSRCATGNR